MQSFQCWQPHFWFQERRPNYLRHIQHKLPFGCLHNIRQQRVIVGTMLPSTLCWDTDERQRQQREAHHRRGQPPPETGEAVERLRPGQEDGRARAEKDADLGRGVKQHLQQRAEQPRGRHEQHTEQHIRQLRDAGVGQPEIRKRNDQLHCCNG